jgi:hypothetical protein
MNIDLSKLKKLTLYFTNINELIILYLTELKNNLESKDNIEIIEEILNINDINKIIKKIDNIYKDNDNILKYFKLYEQFTNLLDKLDNLIQIIYKINIYEEKTLLSDTSKNNINKNKEIIIDLNNKIAYKSQKYINIFLNDIENNIKLNHELYLQIIEYIEKNIHLILLYNKCISKYLQQNLQNDTLTKIILFNNNIIKNELLASDNSNYNNLDKEYNYLFKNNFINITNYKNKIHTFHNLHLLESFNSIYEIFNKYFNLENVAIKKQNNLLVLYKSLILLKQKIKQEYCLLIIKSDIDNINYNISNLISDNIILQKDQGINNDFINKTKIIVTKEEYKTLPNISKFQNDIYISNISKIDIVNTYKKNKNIQSSELLINTNFIVILEKDNKFHLMRADNNDDYTINFNQIKTLLLNNPNYIIENYNELIEENYEDNKSYKFLDLYNEEIAKNYQASNNTFNINVIKNNINNFIKTKKKLTSDQIIQIIIDNIIKYIKEVNNIQYNSELYLTLNSSINNFYSKLKKEIFDSYPKNQDLINNISSLLDNLSNNISTINNNILDKYYILSLANKYN